MPRSVGNPFSPLTPKHGFPSHTYKTKGAPLPSARTCGMLFCLLSIIKTGNSDLDVSRNFCKVPPLALSKSGISGRRAHLPLSLSASSPLFNYKQKQEASAGMPPVKNPCETTSYGGITRIRLKGRSSITSSQPASQAPLYLFVGHIIHRGSILCNW